MAAKELLLCVVGVGLLATGPARGQIAAPAPVVHWHWPASHEGTAPEVAGPRVVLGLESQAELREPERVPFHNGTGLRLSRERQTVASVTDGERLRITGPLTIAVVAQFSAPVASKSAIVSKWYTQNGWRSYELGILPQQRLFFDISGSGNWDANAREVLSSRSLAADTPYLLVGVYEPGQRMAVYVNGRPFGEVRSRVPSSIFDSPTPVYLGNRHRSLAGCAFDGLLGDVRIFERALSKDEVSRLARDVGLTAEPERAWTFTPPFDLDALKTAAREWYEKLQAPDAPYGAYRLSPRHEPDMYASADIAWCRYIMDDLELTEEQRQSWVGFIQDQQDEDGTYRHLTGHCTTHALCHATGALSMLGGTHRYPPRLLRDYARPERVGEWLDGINWVNQWGGSHDIWGAGLPLVCSEQTADEWEDAVFTWLGREVDPETGFWRKDVESRTRMEYLGGAFHIWPLFAADGRPLPYPERVIDSVLALRTEDGLFGGDMGYSNMDAVWVLGYLTQRTDYRRDDIQVALRENLAALAEAYALAPEQFLSGAHSTLSRIATLSMLQEAMPELFESATRWRNPWHERRLYAIEY